MDAETFLREWYNDKPYVVVHTSGSTGIPKSIQLGKDLMARSARRTISFFDIQKGDRLHLPLSVDYIAGKMMLVRGEVAGAEVTIEEPSNHVLANYDIGSARCSRPIKLISLVPSQIPDMLERIDEVPEIRNILVGGAAIPVSTREMLVRSGIPSYESYGMTETASHVAIRRITEDPDQPFEMLEGISCFMTAKGTLGIKEGTMVVETNDVAEILSETQFIFKGRKDNIINSGGIKLYPEEIERKLAPIMESTLGADYYITSRKSIKWGEEAVLVVEVPEVTDQTECCLKSIKAQMAGLFDGRHKPKDILVLDSFQRTSSGKVKRIKF